MTNRFTSLPVNPLFAAHMASQRSPVYAKLPMAPINASPVPHLTSLYHHDAVGPYGNRGYPGNCGGSLIRDLLRYFQPATVLDPMTGSGTCRDVSLELGIECFSTDLRDGFDACHPASYPIDRKYDFIWVHPPYWRQKVYSSDPRDMSRCRDLGSFLDRLAGLLQGCSTVLAPSGKLAILIGDYVDREAGFVPLVYHAKRLAFEAGLSQHCTDIIRFSHGATSSRKVYRSAFIPTLHDVCLMFE